MATIRDIREAIAQFSCIPSIKTFYTNDCSQDAINILEETAGLLEDGKTAYRIYSAAAMWLELNPDLFFIKKHDRTEMGDPTPIIKALRRRQALYDKANLIIAPIDEQITVSDESVTFSFVPIRL